ncbi:MAG: TolC family protein [Gemmataceae bacterium]
MRKRVFLLTVLTAAGCSRPFWRNQADGETYPIIGERVLSPAFAVGPLSADPPPNSRIGDPFDPNFPPKPPDDPAAAAFMAHPYKFRGCKGWAKDGTVDRVEFVDWEAGLGIPPGGTLKLDQTKAVEIALLNNRDLQSAREDVYLSALALTLNRFDFDVQWFARTAPTYTRIGASSLPFEANTLDVTSGAGFHRNLAAGGQLLVNFANSFVWEFTGKTHTVTGNLGGQLIQPLLRGFGRDVRLEGLTQGERDVLYAVRDYARFRKQFWAGVAVDSSGYLNLLLLQQNVRNAQANLKSQEQNYAVVQEQFRGGRKSVVDVDQILQGLLSARRDVIQAELALQTALDQFKLRLGLPPRLPVEVDDSYLDQFVLVDPAVEQLREAVDTFERERKQEVGNPPPAAAIRGHFTTLLELAGRADVALVSTASDIDRWRAVLQRPAPGETPEQRDQATTAFAASTGVVPDQTKAIAALRRGLADQRATVTDADRKGGWDATLAWSRKLAAVLDALIAAQTQARIYLIQLPEIHATEPESLAFAKANRLDLMNQLGRVTDAWRKVTVTANALEADLTVVAGANVITDPASRNPFNFSNDVSRYSVGVQFDSPLVRQAERNTYRAAQISYQRSRRAYMLLSDGIEFAVRDTLRSLRVQQLQFDIAKQSLLAASRQLESQRLQLSAPQGAEGAGGGGGMQLGGGSGGDATLRLLTAQNQLLEARNGLASSFVSYEQLRIRLLLELEALQLDDRGFPTNAAPARPEQPAGPGGRDGPGPGPDNPVFGPPAGNQTR